MAYLSYIFASVFLLLSDKEIMFLVALVRLFAFLSVCLFVFLSVCLSVCLSSLSISNITQKATTGLQCNVKEGS